MKIAMASRLLFVWTPMALGAWVAGLDGESCSAACARVGGSCNSGPLKEVMTACADNEDAWRLLGVVWSAAGSSLVCDNFTELAGETTAPSYRDGACGLRFTGPSSCEGGLAGTQRLCCCESDQCPFDAGYCSAEYETMRMLQASNETTDASDDLDVQMVAGIAGFGGGLFFVLCLGAGICIGRYYFYDRLRNRTMARLRRPRAAEPTSPTAEVPHQDAEDAADLDPEANFEDPDNMDPGENYPDPPAPPIIEEEPERISHI
ncbi:unnamed protein product [Effrenium voratum]|uniref:Uncharacterized protein n=1 Tax=Effrenium voratum TaxID=2562239 RepID=A0AA36I5D5_9DINO|nr:unnamed protein product [Effrenium voratum]CAJ1451719.1 unnamed protein product [Effrenium voratum]